MINGANVVIGAPIIGKTPGTVGTETVTVVREGRSRGATVTFVVRDERNGTNTCSVSIIVCARFMRSRSARGVAPRQL